VAPVSAASFLAYFILGNLEIRRDRVNGIHCTHGVGRPWKERPRPGRRVVRGCWGRLSVGTCGGAIPSRRGDTRRVDLGSSARELTVYGLPHRSGSLGRQSNHDLLDRPANPRESSYLVVVWQGRERLCTKNDLGGILEASNERGRIDGIVPCPTPQRVELLEKSHERMNTPDTPGAVFVKITQLPHLRELVVNERRHVSRDERNHACSSDLE